MDKTTVSVSFTLIGEDFNINYVSDILDISPTYKRDKNEILGNGKKFGHTEWGIGTDYEESIDIGVQLNKILSVIEGKTDLLNRVRVECNAEWNLVIVIYIENGETPIISFSKQFLKFIASIEAEVGFDVYVLSEKS